MENRKRSHGCTNDPTHLEPVIQFIHSLLDFSVGNDSQIQVFSGGTRRIRPYNGNY